MYIQDTRIPGKDIHMYRVYHPTIYMYICVYILQTSKHRNLNMNEKLI